MQFLGRERTSLLSGAAGILDGRPFMHIPTGIWQVVWGKVS